MVIFDDVSISETNLKVFKQMGSLFLTQSNKSENGFKTKNSQNPCQTHSKQNIDEQNISKIVENDSKTIKNPKKQKTR